MNQYSVKVATKDGVHTLCTGEDYRRIKWVFDAEVNITKQRAPQDSTTVYWSDADFQTSNHKDYYCNVWIEEEPTMTPEERDHAEIEQDSPCACGHCAACADEAADDFAELCQNPDFARAVNAALASQGAAERVPVPAETAERIRDHEFSFSCAHCRAQWTAATRGIKFAVAGAALALACLLPGHASARESQTQAFLTPPSGYELYLAFEDHSSLAFNASTGEWIAFDPDAPAGAAHGWHQSPWLGRTSAR